MKKGYVLKTLIIFCLALFLVVGGFFIPSLLKNIQNHPSSFIKKVKVIKPNRYPSFYHLVKVELQIKDDSADKDGHILEVIFNNHKISLKPPDPTGKRGSVHFQLKPGKYLIKWKTEKAESHIWPRITSHKKIITLKKNYNWVYILIKGNTISMS